MGKRYKLIADSPTGVKAGTIFFKNIHGDYGIDRNSYLPDIAGMRQERFAIHANCVENNPKWFKEIAEMAQVEFYQEPSESFVIRNVCRRHKFRVDCSIDIPKEKFTAIKSAIENVLNDVREVPPQSEKLYTEEELLEAEERAFYAGQVGIGKPMYKSFFHYKNRIVK